MTSSTPTTSQSVIRNIETSSNVTDLLEKITSFIDTCEFQSAHILCTRALSIEPENSQLLETTGTIELELEMYEQAKEHFAKAISISPTTGYSIYMYMGQMSEGLDSVRYFQQGVDLMSNELSQVDGNSDEAKTLRRKISSALCSMTEIYLTDCCFEPDAEMKCDLYLNQALDVDNESPEVYQLLASVRLSQERIEEAKLALEKSMSFWANKDLGDQSVPSYELRISLVKLLLELAEYSKALDVLSDLQQENDEVVDLWYLYGWCYYCMGEGTQDENERIVNWKDARDCLTKCKKLFHTLNTEDEGILQHAKELLQIINSTVQMAQSNEDNEDVGEEDSWEDYSSDGDGANEQNEDPMEL